VNIVIKRIKTILNKFHKHIQWIYMMMKENIRTQMHGDIMDLFDKVQQIPYIMQLTCRSFISKLEIIRKSIEGL